MANKMYVKEGMNFEGISMQEGKSSSTLKLLAFMIVTAIILGVIIFAASNYFSSNLDKRNDSPKITVLPTSSKPQPTSTPEPTTSVTPSVTPKVTGKPTPTLAKSTTPTPTASTKTSSLSVEIQNGSGTKGAAGKMSLALKNAGYTVLSTGNADSFTYKGITVNMKKSKATALAQLKKDLSANDYLVTDSTTTLPETSAADAVIIIGSE